MKRPVHVSDVPELIGEWDYEKNDGLQPDRIAFRTQAVYWWKCPQGHGYKASPHNRAAGKGCPYCSGRNVLQGFNDLASQRPEIMEEWDYDKNTDLSPQKVSVSSGKKAWWICSAGHSWKAVIASRSNGCGCPYCAGRLLTGYNDLATLRPDLTAEWDHERNEVKPEEVTASSARKVWWKCGKGHGWMASVANRARGTGCPVCINKKIVPGENGMATLRPDLAAEWDYDRNTDICPENISPGSGRSVWWKCEKGHSWQAPPGRRMTGAGCPYCSNKYVWKGYNDFASQCPELLEEWDYGRNEDVLPDEITLGSTRKVWWICKEGHSWEAYPYDRRAGHGCPYCSGHSTIAGYNDLQSRYPELMTEWDFEKNILYLPDQLTPGSNYRVWWKCKKGHSWQASPNHRTRGNECPYCANKKVLAGYNDLATVMPEIAAQWDQKRNHKLRPDQVTTYSQKTVFWECEKGHSWRAIISNRTDKGHGCPYCAGQRVLTGENDLQTLYPGLAEQWDYERNYPLTPDKVMPHSQKKVWWICGTGHHWRAAIYARHSHGCPYCSGRVPIIGVNDLKTVSPELADEWDYNKNGRLIPEELMPMSNRKVWWKCSKGHSYRMAPRERQDGIGCPQCSGHVKMKTTFIS